MEEQKKRNKQAIIAVIVAVVIGIIGITAGIVARNKTPTEPEPTSVQATVLETTEDNADHVLVHLDRNSGEQYEEALDVIAAKQIQNEANLWRTPSLMGKVEKIDSSWHENDYTVYFKVDLDYTDINDAATKRDAYYTYVEFENCYTLGGNVGYESLETPDGDETINLYTGTNGTTHLAYGYATLNGAKLEAD